jgi:alpha-L-arabinofuranosidase
MKRSAILYILLTSTQAYAQTIRIQADAAKVVSHTPAYLYGSCIEDVNHEIYGGLYDQRVFGESFEEPPRNGVSRMWQPMGEGHFELDSVGAYNGRRCQVIEQSGVYNKGLNGWGIAVKKGHAMVGSVYLKSEQPLAVYIALQKADGSVTYARATMGKTGRNWARYDFKLSPSASDDSARFAIYTNTPGKLYIDQATLMAAPADQFKGLYIRKDIALQMQAEGLRFLRYGGTMVNAPEYRWKKMIGPRDQRPPYKGHWYPYSSNGFGIFDFLQYCEAAGFESAFAMNIEETAADAADLAEYLKGDTTTVWGRKRAADGHPAPYKVKYIEIGNEEVLFDGDRTDQYDHYIERFLAIYNAMHAKDSTLLFVNSVWWRPSSPNSEKLFKAIDGKAAYWDLHVDADEPNAGLKVDKDLTQMQALFHQWSPNTRVCCTIFEENGGLHNLQRALGHATILNAVRRHGNFVLASCAANALQALRQNDNGWDQGQIFFTPAHAWGMPPFYATQMAARNHQPVVCEASADSVLDVTATQSEKSVVLHIVNPGLTPRIAQINVAHFSAVKKKVQVSSLSGAPSAENVVTRTFELPVKQNTLEYTIPASSYTIIHFE